ncbi:MAG: substrate-binding domain-containing protein [Actinobacteria bacterium]|nr:substrate-binding domain-containing protein [Actinomycetota bacterium]
MQPVATRLATTAGICALGLVAAACGSSGSSSGGASASPSASAPAISATSFTRDFSAMSGLKPLAGKGKGNVAVILPDTVSSARYVEFDAPYLTKALKAAGLSSSQFTVQNAQGSDSTELSDAQTAITKGASVLIMDPLDSGVGTQIEKYAASHGVAVVDYDRLTLGGSRKYYVSFNNVNVGKLLGQGLANCISAWQVAKPNVLVMYGDPTDNNATLFGDGYNAVMKPFFSSGKWKQVGKAAGTWDPPTALTEFQQQFTAHPNINAVLMPNDENAAPIITYLQRKGVKAKSLPITGQDATLIGLQNVLSGYQCGTVYKPIYLEAQAAAALAMYLRAGVTPPAALVNGKTADTKSNVSVPSVLLTPQWVTPSNMNSTIIADGFVPAKQLCKGKYQKDCAAAGISG